MVNNSIITKNTGWHKPTRVEQDSRYGVVNAQTCFAYSSLGKIKKKDKDCAYIPKGGGVNSIHKSAFVYCSGYNFNIPNSATITKVLVRQTRRMGNIPNDDTYIVDNLIKLKTGASTTDSGVGYNLSTGEKWNTKKQGYGNFVTGDKTTNASTLWGITLTPAVTNNQNFGCVVQCIGTGDAWLMPQIDCIEMCVYYTQVNDSKTAPSTTSNDENVKSKEKEQSVQIESKLVKEYQPDDSEVLETTASSISEDYLYSPFVIWVRYRNYLDSSSDLLLKGYNDEFTITLNENLRFSDGTKTMKIPAYEFKLSTDPIDINRGYKTAFKEVYVYPVKAGTGTVTADGVYYNSSKRTQTINLTVEKSSVSLSNSICELNKVTFKDCDATKGSAIYNLGALTVKNLTLNDITTTDKCFYDYDKYRDGEYR